MESGEEIFWTKIEEFADNKDKINETALEMEILCLYFVLCLRVGDYCNKLLCAMFIVFYVLSLKLSEIK